jgi:hypothetical protein
LEAAVFFSRFVSSFFHLFNYSCYKPPKNAIKKLAKTSREGGGGKYGRKEATFVCDEPRHFSSRVFELSLLRNAQKRDKKNKEEKKKEEVSN